MSDRVELDPEGCPLCKGTGKILLLNAFADCNECVATRDRRQKAVDKARQNAFDESLRNNSKGDDDDGA